MSSRQDHPISWTASRQQRYIYVLQYNHHPGTSAPDASFLDQAPHPRMMTSKDGNSPRTSVPDSAADISALSADPETVPPTSPPQVLLQASVPATLELTEMFPTTLYQVPLPPSARTSDGIVSALSGRFGFSARDLRRQQDRDHLTYILSITSLTVSPYLLKAVMSRISTISYLTTEKCAKLESLLLSDGSAPLPDDIKDLLSLAWYANRYSNARGNHTTKSMWSEINVKHYELFYLTFSFAVHNFTETYLDNSTFCFEGSVQNSKSKDIFQSVRGINRKLSYPKINFPIFLPVLIHPYPNRTNLILWFLQGLLRRFPWGPIIWFPLGICFWFPLGTCPIL